MWERGVGFVYNVVIACDPSCYFTASQSVYEVFVVICFYSFCCRFIDGFCSYGEYIFVCWYGVYRVVFVYVNVI